MMQEVEVLKTIPELVCSYFSEEQFTLSRIKLTLVTNSKIMYDRTILLKHKEVLH